MLAATAATALGLTSRPAAAETAADWPSKAVRLIVPNVPGGGIDLIARTLQAGLLKVWTQQVMVDYKPGAGTALGTEYVARAAPDGYTLGLVVTTHVINPSLRKLPYDTLRDFSHVSLIAVSGLVLAVSPKVPVNSLKELIEYAKSKRGALSYATPGVGSSLHLSGELLKQQTGLEMQHVPYKGSGSAYSDVFEGRVEVLIDPIGSAISHVRGGRLKAIAVLGAKRDATLPTVAAIGETIPGFNVQSITGIVVPAATPPELVKKISADLARVLKSPEIEGRLREVGVEAVGSTPAEFDTLVRAELKRWDRVVKQAAIALD